MIFGEMVPKNIAIARPLETARATQGFMRGFTALSKGPIRALNGSANAIVRRLGIEPQEELRSARSSQELASLVQRSADQGTLDADTAELVERSVEFGTRTTGEIMTPRVRTTTVEDGDRVSSVIDLARQTGHSRFPVLDAEDTVVGTVHVKHAVAVPVHERATTRIKHVMVRPVVVPDSLRLDPLLALLRQDGFQMAIVLDEYGGHAGIVTLEDVVEEIVGDISDEHDRLGARIRQRRDGSWTLSGLLRPDEVEDATDVELPDHEDYDTVAGLVMRELGKIPEPGDRVEVPVPDRTDPHEPRERLVTLTVERMDGLRIDRLDLRIVAERRRHRPARGPTMNGDLFGVVLAVVLLALNAFFVGAEFALLAARRSQIEPRAQQGSRAARTTLRAMENISLVMAGAQLGITVCSLGLGAIGEPAVAHLLEPVFHAARLPDNLLHPVAFVVAMSIVVYLHVVLGEMVPKNIALAGADRAALVLSPPMMVIVTVLRPVIAGMNMVANGVLRLLRIEPKDEVHSSFTREEVAALVEESRGEGLIEAEEYDRLAGALGFTEKSVESILMTPDTLATVAPGSTVADVEAVCAATGFSRFPVAGPDGALLGYLHIKDALESDDDRRSRVIEDKWIRPFATVHPDDLLHDALESLQVKGAHMARVVRRDGAVVGLVTLEDVLEELVGEIRDAAHHDVPGVDAR